MNYFLSISGPACKKSDIAEANHLILDDKLPISATVFGQRNSPYLFFIFIIIIFFFYLGGGGVGYDFSSGAFRQQHIIRSLQLP